MEKDRIYMPRTSKVLKKNKKIKLLSADDNNLTEKDLKKSHNELNETEERKKNCLQELREKLSSDEINYRTDDEYLLRFLRVRKFETDKAFKTIQDFYSVRRKHPDIFDFPHNLEALLNMNFTTRLPYVDEEGRIFIAVDYGKWNPAEVPFFKLLSFITVVSDIVTMNPKSQINGVITILDLKGLTPSHLAEFVYPRRVALFTKILQSCYPWRIKGLIGDNCGKLTQLLYKMFQPFLNKKIRERSCYPWRIKGLIGDNCGKLTQLLYKMFQPFLNKKIRERVFFVGSDMKELHRLVNPAVLPKQLGGKLEENECSITQQVLNNLSYLKYERSFGTDCTIEK